MLAEGQDVLCCNSEKREESVESEEDQSEHGEARM